MSVRQARELEALKRTLSNASEKPIKLSYPVIEIITHDFAVEIGHGVFAAVYLGSLPVGRIAVQRLNIMLDLNDERFRAALNCLIRARHENIVRFLGYCQDTQGEIHELQGSYIIADVRQRILCFEFIPNGNLYDYLEGKPSRDEWHIRYQIIKGICQGLKFLHDELIIHLDLKPGNVMLDTQMNPKIKGFSCSRIFDEGQSKDFDRNICGRWGYIAPETIENSEISFKNDIFSLGIIIINLLTGRNKYDPEKWQDLVDVDGPEANICSRLAQTCVQTDQYKRPTIGHIIHDLSELQDYMKRKTKDITYYRHQAEYARKTHEIEISCRKNIEALTKRFEQSPIQEQEIKRAKEQLKLAYTARDKESAEHANTKMEKKKLEQRVETLESEKTELELGVQRLEQNNDTCTKELELANTERDEEASEHVNTKTAKKKLELTVQMLKSENKELELGVQRLEQNIDKCEKELQLGVQRFEQNIDKCEKELELGVQRLEQNIDKCEKELELRVDMLEHNKCKCEEEELELRLKMLEQDKDMCEELELRVQKLEVKCETELLEATKKEKKFIFF